MAFAMATGERAALPPPAPENGVPRPARSTLAPFFTTRIQACPWNLLSGASFPGPIAYILARPDENAPDGP